ncbi:MAG: Holliday junction branch migration protein RuvA [Candidatus Shapirobacteria bacterium]
MISFLKGKIIFLGANKIDLLVNNIGYEVFLPAHKLVRLTLDQELEIFVYQYLTEDRNQLFGFLARRDKEVFELLIGVSGVGPKTALSIFAAGGGEQIIQAVQQASLVFFQQVKGLGTKTAQRIIVDLKNKAGGLKDLDFQAQDEVVLALRGLGFRVEEIRAVLTQLPADLLTEEEKIKFALKNLSQK